jgi:hypothetical protein
VLGGRGEVVIAARNISLHLSQISFSTDNWTDIHLLDAHEYFRFFCEGCGTICTFRERTQVWFDLPVAGSQNLSLSYRVRYGTQSPPIFDLEVLSE